MIITTKIGPTFTAELLASDLPRDGVLWTSGSVITSPPFDDDAHGAKLRELVAAHDPSKQLPIVTVLPKIDLWRAMTDAEHAAMVAGVAQQPQRIQDIFNATDNFRSDAPEWPLLQQMATQLYGAARAAQLLTPAAST